MLFHPIVEHWLAIPWRSFYLASPIVRNDPAETLIFQLVKSSVAVERVTGNRVSLSAATSGCTGRLAPGCVTSHRILPVLAITSRPVYLRRQDGYYPEATDEEFTPSARTATFRRV